MIFAVLIPWLFFREKFDLFLHEADLNKLTEGSRDLILYRQETLLTTGKIIPYLSVGVFLLGLILLIIGLFKWSQKQKVIDEHRETLLDKTKKEIEAMGFEEKLKSAVKESDLEMNPPNHSNPPKHKRQTSIKNNGH